MYGNLPFFFWYDIAKLKRKHPQLWTSPKGYSIWDPEGGEPQVHWPLPRYLYFQAPRTHGLNKAGFSVTQLNSSAPL